MRRFVHTGARKSGDECCDDGSGQVGYLHVRLIVEKTSSPAFGIKGHVLLTQMEERTSK